MEIPKTLLKYKLHILAVLVLALAVSALVLVAPSFLSILAYFWPLFLSTALFLVAIIVFGKTSPPPSSSAVASGEELLDYVAGQTEQVEQVEDLAAAAGDTLDTSRE